MNVTSQMKIFKIFEKFFFAFFGILGNFTWFEIEKKIWKFLEVTVTWSNEQMVTLLEVMITSPISEQMVEANIKIQNL